jgi:MFS family permease
MDPIVRKLPEFASLSAVAQSAAIKPVLQKYASTAFFVQQFGAFFGMIGYAWISERIGRKPALFIAFILAFLSVQAAFWGARDALTACALALPMGICALAPFSAYAVFFPELFPTRLRATGVGFCYNCARILAAIAPLTLGKLAAYFADLNDKAAGLRVAASIIACIYAVGFIGLRMVPETRGEPLPE